MTMMEMNMNTKVNTMTMMEINMSTKENTTIMTEINMTTKMKLIQTILFLQFQMKKI